MTDAISLINCDCFGALDLGATSDLCSLGMLFPHEGGFFYRARCWCPREASRWRDLHGIMPSYEPWARAGLITFTEGDVVDYDFIRRDINALGKRFRIREIAYDPFAATQIMTQLMGDGFTMVQFRQGFLSLSAPTKELERLIALGRIWHGGNPVVRWQASNVQVETDPAGNIKPTRANRRTQKIDSIITLVMCIGRAAITPEGGGKSVYDERGLLQL